MPKKSPIKIDQKSQRTKVKIHCLTIALALFSVVLPTVMHAPQAQAASCPDVKLIFARGSGATRYDDKNYNTFKSTIESKLSGSGVSYEFEDLDYPAISAGIDHPLATLGAFIGGGDSYAFGESVSQGVQAMTNEINSNTCSNTKYVIAGYSQGALVIDKVLPSVAADKVLYAATFGDPKIYLPEGKGVRGSQPDACSGKNLSDYRMYVPDCKTYKGMLGATIPYRPNSLAGRVGTWCNRRDFFCSPYLDMNQHSAYVSDGLYEDASKVIYSKVVDRYGANNPVTSPHDTVILLDSTSSMSSMINAYKAEALRLARETLESGGRVALYDYRDLRDDEPLTEHCTFENCTLALFEQELNSIVTKGGDDAPESLLSASFKSMHQLHWQYGSTKSLVVLTDSNFLSPDRDGTTLEDVVSYSKIVDPVNFYIITNQIHANHYAELASRTDGKVVTDMNQLSLLTDYIMDRYDSLPRVEEASDLPELPTLSIDAIERIDDTSARVSFTTNGVKTLVILNDTMLGVTNQTVITLTDLKPDYDNVVTLVPLTDDLRGDPISASLKDGAVLDATLIMPKAPNTGWRNFD